MKLSIIMPSLNVVNYITECLQSIITQTIQDFEIICVDAGSTDGTLEIIKEFADKDSRIKIINSEVKSYGYQMNLGIRAAVGTYIGIVETDDYIDAEMFEDLYKYTDNNNVDFVKSSYNEFFDIGNKRIKRKRQCESVIPVQGKILNLNEDRAYRLADTNHIWSAIYKRDFIIKNNIRFNETPGASFQDTSFSILVGLMANTCVYISACHYQYRIDREESSVKSDSKYKCIIDEFDYINLYMVSHNIDNLEYKIEVIKQKLCDYKWNMIRLHGDSRRLFRDVVKDDIINIKKCYFDKLDNKYIEICDFLLDISNIEKIESEHKKKKEVLIQYIKAGINNGGYVIAGAGRMFSKLISIQEVLGEDIVKAVCDNDKAKQGCKVFNHYVVSVEEAALLYHKDNWLILNQKYGSQIQQQLINCGVLKQNINVIDYLPEPVEFIGNAKLSQELK